MIVFWSKLEVVKHGPHVYWWETSTQMECRNVYIWKGPTARTAGPGKGKDLMSYGTHSQKKGKLISLEGSVGFVGPTMFAFWAVWSSNMSLISAPL